VDRDISSVRSDHAGIIARRAVVVALMLVIALIHVFRVGTYLDGTLFTVYYSYFSDIVIPFGMYFLLCLNDVSFPLLRDWRVKALLVFAVSSLTEVMQAFGVPLLGLTFDPLDIVMFGVGTLAAVFVDRFLFERTLPFWSRPTATR
jgi:hypothetical protein